MSISLKKNTCYWIYSIPESIFDNSTKEKSTYIGFNRNYDIRKNDVIFFTVEKKGFVGFSQMETNIVFNKDNDIHIYKNLNISQYYCKGKIYTQSKIILVKEIFPKIKINIKNYNTSISFTRNIMPEIENMIIINKDVGKKILVELIQDRVESEHSEESEDEIIQDYSEYTNNTSSTCRDDSDCEYNSESEDEKDNYIIPICVTLCKYFILGKNNKIEQIMEHIKKCRKCNITDNNDFSAINSFNNSTEFIEITEENDYEIEEMLDSYYNAEEYKEINKNSLYYINYSNSIYYKCCFFVGHY